jgi:hypothetical protein
MTDPKDQIARLVQDAEEAAYRRGWNDACAAMIKAADSAKTLPWSKVPTSDNEANSVLVVPHHARTGGRPASATIGVVEDCITASPGRKGVEVVKAAQMIDPSIPERTVRTALRRLKLNKKIWQRNGLWYPKPPRERLLLETDDGEADSSPPHH